MAETRRKHKGNRVLIITGLLLIAAALLLVAYNMYVQARARRASEDVLTELAAKIGERTEGPEYMMDPNIDMPVVIIDGRAYVGIITIPDLDVQLPVLSEWSYPNLKIAPCRYFGTPYLDNFVIAAHNYDMHFGRIRTLRLDSTVVFRDVLGNDFKYSVAEVEVLEPTAVPEMRGSDYPLTLFTCTLGGASRVTVRCDREQ